MRPLISIISIYYNTPHEILDSLASIASAVKGCTYEIIIVDNNSPLPLPKKVSSFSKVRVLSNRENIGFGAAINQAVKKSRGEYLLLLNPDTVCFPQAVTKMYKRIKRDKRLGIIGPKVLDKNGNVLDTISNPPYLPSALVIFSLLKHLWPFRSIEENYHLRNLDRDREHFVPVIGGACMFLRKDVFERAEGFDKRFFMYFEEADLSLRVQKLGLRNVYFPQAKVTHFVGRSSSDSAWIQRVFERSRYLFFNKYHGFSKAILTELFLRSFTFASISLLLLLSLSSFLIFYRLDELMMFFGDFGRDYLTARDAILHSNIPLVGITSSVTWLHQGPLSVWFIALSFLGTDFNPLAPVYLYGFFSVITTYAIYRLGGLMFTKTAGLLAALFFTTSPLVLVNARIPYHTSPIPLFSAIFLLFLWVFIKKRKFIFFLGLSLGLLLLLELSNAVLFFVLGALYVLYRPSLTRREVVWGIAGFGFGIAAFILYDITHNFVQTGGFFLWIANRIRLFFGLTLSGASTTANIPAALLTVWNEIRRFVYPQDIWTVIVVLILVVSLVLVKRIGYYERFSNGLLLCVVWLCLALVGFIIHAAPGTAYFPLIFVPFSLIVGSAFYEVGKRSSLMYIVFFAIVAANAFYTVKNQYFLDTKTFHGSDAYGWDYGLGEAFVERQKTVDFILGDVKGEPMQIRGGGFLREFESSVDNYKYLLWQKGGVVDEGSARIYTLYQEREEVPRDAKMLYTNSFVYVTKN
ncbi:MAG: glycosyltransferase [Candidatus Levybacteria bacterium]|nr:glycosyltransferase [Candidatus Levybacteria bacterium]